jgi:hypothetical protein
MVRASLRAHRGDDRALDARRLRPWRDEHRQHVDPRSHHRLRPYGWIDDFDPDWTPNTTDAEGRRYRFGQQPQIAYWNLTRLAARWRPRSGPSIRCKRPAALRRRITAGIAATSPPSWG